MPMTTIPKVRFRTVDGVRIRYADSGGARAAFATAEGESWGEAEGGSQDSVLSSALVPLHYPTTNGGEPAVACAIDPASLHDIFAADLPAEQAAVLAATQRPSAEWAFSGPAGPPAGKS